MNNFILISAVGLLFYEIIKAVNCKTLAEPDLKEEGLFVIDLFYIIWVTLAIFGQPLECFQLAGSFILIIAIIKEMFGFNWKVLLVDSILSAAILLSGIVAAIYIRIQ